MDDLKISDHVSVDPNGAHWAADINRALPLDGLFHPVGCNPWNPMPFPPGLPSWPPTAPEWPRQPVIPSEPADNTVRVTINPRRHPYLCPRCEGDDLGDRQMADCKVCNQTGVIWG